MTAQITTIPGGTTQAAVSGTTIQVQPGLQYEIADIAPDGTIGPSLTADQLIMAPNVPDVGDLSVTLPDGTVLVFKGLIELFGSASLVANGEPIVASLEDVVSPAAGPQAPAGPDAGGSSQAFNQGTPTVPNPFGETDPGPINNPDDDPDPLDPEDPNDFIEPLDPEDPDDPGQVFDILFTPRDDEAFMDVGVPLFLPDGSVNPNFARDSGSSGNVDPVTRNVTHALENDDLVHLDDKGGINNLHDLFGEPTAFYGGEGDDTLFGGTDHDIIVGDGLKTPSDGKGLAFGGNDTLEGNDGADTLLGDGLIGAPGVKVPMGSFPPTMDIGFPNPAPYPDELKLINMQAMNAPSGGEGRSSKFDSLDKLLDQFNLGLFGPGGFLDFANDLSVSPFSFTFLDLIGGDDLILGGEGSDLAVGDAIVAIAPCGLDCEVPFFYGPTSQVSLRGGDDDILGGLDNDFLIGDGMAYLPSSLFRPGGTGYGFEGLLKALEGTADSRVRAIGGDDYVSGGEGHDFVMGDGIVVIGGGEGGDDIFNKVTTDTAFGGEGTLPPGLGADVYVEGGDDDLFGGEGDDTMVGDGLIVVTEGGEGRGVAPCIIGGEGDVHVAGGDDYMFGGEGYDDMIGDGIIVATPNVFDGRFCGPKCGTICGPKGTDAVIFGGDDLMVGGEGGDHMVGDGIFVVDDRFFGPYGSGKTVVYAGDDDMFGGEGDDTMIGDGVRTVSPGILSFGEVSGETWMHLLWAFEDDRDGKDCKIGHGGEGNLLVFAGNDFMFGGDGDDYMRGDGIQGFYLDGNDVMFGGEGDDTMFGELGHDLVVGDGLLNVRGGGLGKGGDDGMIYGGGEGFGLDVVGGNYVRGGDDVMFGGDARPHYIDDSKDFFGIDDIVIGDGIVSIAGEDDDSPSEPGEPSTEPGLVGDDSPTVLIGGDDIAFGGTGNDVVIGDGILFVGGETGDSKDPAPSEPSPTALGKNPSDYKDYEAVLRGGDDELWGDRGGFGGKGGSKGWVKGGEGFGGEGGDDLVVGDLLVAVTGGAKSFDDVPKPSLLEGGDDDIVGGEGSDILIGDGNILIPGAAEAVNQLVEILGDVDPLALLSNPDLLDGLIEMAGDLIDPNVLVPGGNMLIGGDDVIYGDNEPRDHYGRGDCRPICGPVCGPVCPPDGDDDDDFDADYDDVIIGDGLAVLGVGLQAPANTPNILEGGDDEIHGQQGNDILIGDLLISNFVGDQLIGGDDVISGGEGSDIILGDGNVDQDIFQNTSLNDLLEDPLNAVTSDVLRTDADPDIQGGDDELDGGSGDDIVLGEGGDDTVDGGDGEDLVAGGTGEDLGIWSGPTLEDEPEPEPDFIDDDDDDQLDGGVLPGSGGFNIGERDFYHGNGVEFVRDEDGNIFITDEERDGPGADQDEIDTLRLILTEEQFSNPDVIDELLEFQDHLANGLDDVVFDFETLPLSVVDWERFEVALEGCEDLVLSNIISVDDQGGFTAIGTAANDLLVGNDNENFMEGQGGDDLIFAFGSNDTVYGDYEDNTADGAYGNDKIIGGEGRDFLVGDTHSINANMAELGDDIIYGDNIEDGDGFFPFGGEDNIYGDVVSSIFYDGEGGDDKLIGGEGGDSIYGETGGSISGVNFKAGDDWISGGEGFDALFGDAGNDLIGNDVIGGDDYIDGGADGDFIFGDAGNSLLYGAQGGNDELHGGEGFDMVTGDAGNHIEGAFGGDDKIVGGEGGDRLYGGASSDIRFGGDDGDDLIVGDTLAYGFGFGITLGAYKDFISGDAGNDIWSESHGGNDHLIGDNKYVQGAEGFGGEGHGGKDNWFIGGGSHTFKMADDNIFGDAGGDIFSSSTGGDDDIVGDNLFVSEGRFGAKNLSLNFVGGGKNDGEDFISGDARNNIELLSHGGNDSIVGDNDIEPLLSTRGSSFIDAGASGDQLFGDAGNDILEESSGGDDDIVGDNFLDLTLSSLFGGEGHGGHGGGEGHGDFCDEPGYGGPRFFRGDVSVNLSGANDQIYGDAGNNIESASMGGDDFIVGDNWVQFSGVDNGKFLHFGDWGGFKSIYNIDIFAGAGDDMIFGDAGNDITENSDGGDDVIYGDNLFEGFPRDRKKDIDDKFFDEKPRPRGGIRTNINDDGGDDVISGDAGGQLNYGSTGGNDEIYGQRGNDFIAGDALQLGAENLSADDQTGITNDSHGGDDEIFGGEGNDVLAGDSATDLGNENGSDTSSGGDDLIYGGEGNDLITGGAGGYAAGTGFDVAGDDVTGEGVVAGNDELYGDAGNDDIYGDALDDVKEGAQAGDDDLYGGEGDDLLVGDAGGDIDSIVALASAGNDNLDGGEGSDVLFGDSAAGDGSGNTESDVRSALNDLGSAASTGKSIGDGPFDAAILALDAERDPEAAGGDDVLIGGEGSDAVFGGAGSDLGIHASPSAKYNSDSEISYYDGGGVGNDDFGHKSGIDDNGDMDTLRLLLTADQMVDPDVWEEINDFLDHINGGDDDEPFHFETLDLVAVEWEKLELALYECPDHVFTIEDVIFGDDGVNTLAGTDGDDTIFGLGNDDELQGEMNGAASFGSDLIVGGDGNDDIFGDAQADMEDTGGDDKLIGGEGEDLVVGDTGANLDGTADDDVQNGGQGGDDKIWGNGGNDELFGDAWDDVKDGSDGGDDYINGGEGRDFIAGDAGGAIKNDSVGGDDEIHGGEGSDTIHGDAANASAGPPSGTPDEAGIFDNSEGGDDKIWGGEGYDTITGDSGTDIGTDLDDNSRGGNDWIGGGEGGDRISGDAGGNIIGGEGGDDDIEGNSGVDTLFGDAGLYAPRFDSKSVTIGGEGGGDIIGGEGGDDWIDGGTDRDVIGGDAARDLALGAEGGDDMLFGGEGSDRITGDAGRDITATSDNEAVEGEDPAPSRGGDDKIYGDDPFGFFPFGGSTKDWISGDAGRHILGGSSGGDDWIDGGEGSDRIVGDAGDDIGDDEEGIKSFGGDDDILGGEGSDFISGDAGGDIEGTSEGGDDWIDGGEGDDEIAGDAGRDIGDNDEDPGSGSFGGDDRIAGGEGQDEISGDALGNLLNGSEGGDDKIWGDFGGEGFEKFGGEGGEGNGTVPPFQAIDVVTDDDDDDDDDRFDDYLAGDAGNSIIQSLGGHDDIFGGEGDDYISGDAGLRPQEEFVLPDNDDDGPDAEVALYGGENGGEGGPDLVNSAGGNDLLVGGEGGDYITGDAFDDIEATSIGGDDEIYGGEGWDVITGDAWDDIEAETQQTGQGDLPIAAGFSMGGGDTIVGGEGSDWISGDAGDNIVDGSRGGDDHIFGDGHHDEAWYRGSADFITGDAGGDIGNGSLGGDDVILGGDEFGPTPFQVKLQTPNGKGIFIGGEGDEIYGDAAGSIFGDSHGGQDLIFGGEGDDFVVGDAKFIEDISTGGDDIIHGGEGFDFLAGDAKIMGDNAAGGDDEIFGGEGGDLILGDADIMFGEASGGHDWIDGGEGSDLLIGDASALLDNSTGGNDHITGGEGHDILFGDAIDAGAFGIEGFDVPIPLSKDMFVGDNGNGGDDKLFGGEGDDFLDGNSGFDSVFGGTGNDFGRWAGGAPADPTDGPRDDYDGNQGDTQEGADFGFQYDTLLLSLGEDQLEDDEVLEEIAEFLAHISTPDGPGGTTGDDVRFTFQTLALTAIEWEKVAIALTGCEDHYIVLGDGEVGDDLANMLTGDAAVNDLLVGLGGNDDLAGDMAGGNDSVYSDDALFGGDGDDKLFGDARTDLTIDGGDDLLVGGDGNDLLVGDTGEPNGDDVESDASGTGSGGDDKLLGGDGEDALYGDGFDDVKEGGEGGDDKLFGGDDDDLLVGDAGNAIRAGSSGGDDELFGGAGNDLLIGDAAGNLGNNDTLGVSILEGGEGGDDLLDGGTGDDELWGDGPLVEGDTGMDTFAFSLAEDTGDDVIKDFELDNDILRFEDVLGGNSLANLDTLVTVTEDGDDVVITRNDGDGSIRIEGIADEGDFGSLADLQDAMDKTIEINPETQIIV